jgi:hypothetical protein
MQVVYIVSPQSPYNHGYLQWTLCINSQVSEQILVHENSEKMLTYEYDEGYIYSNVVIRQVSEL